ncbi:MAG: hypothetical protein WBQ26_04955 [Gemmatimonadaceae bacterium]|nr:hypothetical protein [Gemmatimonadaceae bacterium]
MMTDETRERFVLAVAAQLPGADIFEVHFFAPRRVGGVESGVAVVAAHLRAAPEPIVDQAARADGAESAPLDAEIEIVPAVDEAPLDELPYASTPGLPERYTVLSAAYRHTLKGPERGKWEVVVKAEADAPLVTVDRVVRGVQRRAEDAEEVDRMTGDEVRAVIDAHRAHEERMAGGPDVS